VRIAKKANYSPRTGSAILAAPRVSPSDLSQIGLGVLCDESNLNLVTEAEIRRAMFRYPAFKYSLAPMRLWDWTSNLVLMVHKLHRDVFQCHTHDERDRCPQS
jgi:hypothetical protein